MIKYIRSFGKYIIGLKGVSCQKMLERTIWGILWAVFFLVVIYIGNLTFTLVLGIFMVLGLLEYSNLIRRQGLQPQTLLILTCSLILFFTLYQIISRTELKSEEILLLSERAMLFTLIAFLLISWLGEMLRGSTERNFVNISVNLLGTVYIGFMFAYILLLRFLPDQNGLNYLLFVQLITWSNDSMAYLVGVNFGKHQLLPKISPNKTIEGSLGGLAGGILAAYLLALIFKKPIPFMIFLSTVIVVVGQFGDLVESMIKRTAKVKDSGKFLPGHGGILDRFDSLLLTAPIIYYLVIYFL